MEIQIDSNERTPPKRKNVVPVNTPPQKENPETNNRILSAIKKSAAKIHLNVNIKGFQSSAKKSVKFSQMQSVCQQFVVSRLEQDYQFVRHLGSGNFSSVGLYKSKVSNQLFAIKQNKKSMMSVNEIQALATLSIVAENCSNIIRYYHSWIEQEFIYMAMEYCNQNLAEVYAKARKSKTKIPQIELIKITKQALNALKYLHQNNMVHLDLKPDNMLFHDDTLKLADLGLCRLARVKRWIQLTEGDSRYLARQILNFNLETDLTKADIFSLGISLYEAVTLQNLPNNGQRWHGLRDGVKLKNKSELKKNYSNGFLETMMDVNPKIRPSAKDLLQSTVLTQKKKMFMFSPCVNERERSL